VNTGWHVRAQLSSHRRSDDSTAPSRKMAKLVSGDGKFSSSACRAPMPIPVSAPISKSVAVPETVRV